MHIRDIVLGAGLAVLVAGAAYALFKPQAATPSLPAIISAPLEIIAPAPEPAPETEAAVKKPAAKLPAGAPVIAIIIDDVGLDHKRSARAVRLPGAVTLAYLPYSRHLREQTAAAAAAGHELMVHLPMQPEKAGIDAGPDYLGTDLGPDEIARRVDKNLNAFDGYVAVNNHMGSQFTQDRARLSILMTALKARGAMFIDSKTSSQSIAEKVAGEYGLPASHRDVFIDHVDDVAYVRAALLKIEQFARRNGSAIAIGHPKDVTLSALEAWLPALQEKGFRLVPVSEAIALRQK